MEEEGRGRLVKSHGADVNSVRDAISAVTDSDSLGRRILQDLAVVLLIAVRELRLVVAPRGKSAGANGVGRAGRWRWGR